MATPTELLKKYSTIGSTMSRQPCDIFSTMTKGAGNATLSKPLQAGTEKQNIFCLKNILFASIIVIMIAGSVYVYFRFKKAREQRAREKVLREKQEQLKIEQERERQQREQLEQLEKQRQKEKEKEREEQEEQEEREKKEQERQAKKIDKNFDLLVDL